MVLFLVMGSSLDVIGPITKTTEDTEILFNIIKGKDVYDSTSVEGEGDKECKRIGVPRDFLKQGGIDSDVLNSFEESLDKLGKEGYEIVDIKLPNLDYSLAVYYILMPAEVSSNMARYDGVKYGGSVEGKDLIDGYFKTRGELLGREVRRRILLGTYVLSAGYADQYYNKAWQVRNLIKEDFEKAFTNVDVVALPVAPTPAFKIGEKSEDPLQMYLEDIFTISANLVGIPAISVPTEKEGELPIGIQFIAPQLSESLLFLLGKKFETIR
jgi:aspartyl-tRNA(Asn)/glutamyl-tRNA(Gln) amidotransferase subunit A